jgi:predicted  nucleic acid-binding Zn-ribbon protein
MGEEDLIREYVDRTGFSSDTKFVLDELNKIWAAYQQLDKFKLSLDKNSGLAQVTILAKQAGEEFTKLNTSTERLAESTKKQASANNQLNSSQKDLLELSARNSIATKQLTDERKKLEAAYKSGAVTLDQYTKELADIKDKQTALSVSSQQVNTALKNIEKEAQAAEGSLEQLRAQLNLATQAFDKMSASEKASSTGRELFNKINSLTQVISAEEQATGRFQRNVGNYVGSAKIITEALERSRTKVVEVGRAFGQTSPEAAAARKEFEALDRLTGDPQFLNVASKFGDTNKELKFFTKQLNQLEDAGQKNTQVYGDVQKRLAQLTDQLGDTRAEIKALSSDTRTFDQFAGAVSFAADTFQTAAGAAVLFGASEEDAAKATKTLIAIQSVANGVKGIANELTTKGTAANKIYAFTQALITSAMDKTAAASVRLNAALGIIGIAATVIGGIILAYSALRKSTEDIIEKQSALNEIMEAGKDSYVEARVTVSSLREQIDLAKKGFIDKEGVVKQYNDTIGKTTGEVKNLDGAERELTENADAYIKFTFLKAAANIALQKAAQKAFDAEQLRLAKPKLKKGEKDEFTPLAQAFSKDLDRESDDLNKIGDNFLKQAAEISKKFHFDFSGNGGGDGDKEKAAKKAKEAADKELQVQFNILKLGLQQIADFNKEIVDDDTRTAEQRLIALQKYYIAKNQIADAQAALDKNLGKKTVSELVLIDRQLADEKLRISREVVDKSAEIQKNGIAAGLNLSKDEKDHLDKIGQELLDGFKARTEKELELAKNLLDKKKDLKNQEKELYKSLFTELEGFATDFFTSQLEKQQQSNLDAIASIDAKKAKEIDVINQTVSDRTKAAAEIAIIEAKSQAQKEALEEKNRQIEKRKANIDRLGKIAEITGNTTLGIVSLSVKAAEARAQASLLASNPLTASFAPVALANAALIAAQIPILSGIAALQIARLVLPKFADGKFDDYEGPAIWGDGGKSEMKLGADGSVEISPSTPTLTHVKRNDIILPDAAMALSMGMASMGRQHDNILSGSSIGGDGRLSFDTVNSTLNKGFSMLNRTIQNKKENHFPKPKLSDIVNRTIDGNKEYFERNGFTNW